MLMSLLVKWRPGLQLRPDQMLHDAFHLHETRTFYQHRRGGDGNLLGCGANGVDSVKMARRECCPRRAVVCLDGVAHGVAQTEEMIDAAFARIGADLAVEFG